MKTVLSSVNETINNLELKGYYSEADRLEAIFIKIAQNKGFLQGVGDALNRNIVQPIQQGYKNLADAVTGKFNPPPAGTFKLIGFPPGVTGTEMLAKTVRYTDGRPLSPADQAWIVNNNRDLYMGRSPQPSDRIRVPLNVVDPSENLNKKAPIDTTPLSARAVKPRGK